MSTSNAAVSTPNAVWVERASTRQYTGRNSSGAEVRIDMGLGEFSPGKLMKIALATCNTLSTNHRLAEVLDENFEATVGCSTVKNNARERYESSQVEIVTDLSSLDAEQRELFSQRVAGAVDRHCTVGHTIEHGAFYTTAIIDPNEDWVLKHSGP